MPESLLAIFLGIPSAVIISWVTVQLSLKQFRTEKWWELKVNAYSRVIEALHYSKAFSDAHLDAREAGREVDKERDHELRCRSKEAHAEIRKAMDLAGFLLSKEAQERLQRLNKELHDASNEISWDEYLAGDQAATSSCLSDLIKIAIRDLRGKG